MAGKEHIKKGRSKTHKSGATPKNTAQSRCFNC
jgi:hypothetical protein